MDFLSNQAQTVRLSLLLHFVSGQIHPNDVCCLAVDSTYHSDSQSYDMLYMYHGCSLVIIALLSALILAVMYSQCQKVMIEPMVSYLRHSNVLKLLKIYNVKTQLILCHARKMIIALHLVQFVQLIICECSMLILTLVWRLGLHLLSLMKPMNAMNAKSYCCT